MILLALLLLAQGAETAPPRLPQDWSGLPALRFVVPPRPDATVSLFVRAETEAGRCAAATRTADGWMLRVDMAVLVGADGRARQIVPRAIHCPTVEQFAAGLMSRMTRDAIDSAGIAGETWAKTSLTFAWTN